MALDLNTDKMNALGTRLHNLFGQYKKDRRETELQWLRNMRQFRGIYDPEVEKNIPTDQSRAYPKITRTKVIGTVARLMEMMFPQTEKNWGIRPSPLPDLSTDDVQKVLDSLTGGAAGSELTNEQIEKGIEELAKEKSKRMEKVMEDNLDEIEYIALARKVVFSGVLYSAGVLKGPNIVSKKSRTWAKDANGRYTAREVAKFAPTYEVTPVWDWYPDLSAKTFAQMDGAFWRHIFSRSQLQELADRPDFLKDVINQWMNTHLSGNYKELEWERELRNRGDRSNLTDLSGRKYEAWEWWGYVTGSELRACGITVADADIGKEFEATVWGIDGTVIKAKLNPFKTKVRPYHVFVFEEDDINLLGNGVPQIMRDSQMAICEAVRMLLDNASVVCGPIMEVNEDLLTPGQSLDLHAFKIFVRQGQGQEAGQPAVRQINVDGHLAELQGIVNMFREIADTETALPPAALGDVSRGGSEALRTQGNLSMLMGAAALPIRDTVRNFDTFTTSFITSLYNWNMEFNDRDDIKGDYSVIARGSTSLIAKEVRATTLDAFVATLTPEERMYLNTEKVLKERMAVRDLPDSLMEDPEVVKQKLAEQAQNAKAAADQAARQIDSVIRKNISNAFKDLALAVKANTSANVDTFNALMEAINAYTGEGKGEGAGTAPGNSSGAA